jgi:hypothetical protein
MRAIKTQVHFTLDLPHQRSRIASEDSASTSARFAGPIAGKYGMARGERVLSKGCADLVAFGRPAGGHVHVRTVQLIVVVVGEIAARFEAMPLVP